MNFKIGDVVRLKSGGQKMVVSNYFDSDPFVGVVWISDNGEYHSFGIHRDCLEKVAKDEK